MSSQKKKILPKNCEQTMQGVAKLSTFRLPSKSFRGSEGNVMPLCPNQLRNSGYQQATKNATANGTCKKKLLSAMSGRPLSSSSNSLLRVVSPGGTARAAAVVGTGGKRLLSLDSSAHLVAVHSEEEWLSTQRKLVAEAAQFRRQRDQQMACCASVGASYAFLALSVALSLSVVIAVCLFLHSFVPKEYNQHRHNASSAAAANDTNNLINYNQSQHQSVPYSSAIDGIKVKMKKFVKKILLI